MFESLFNLVGSLIQFGVIAALYTFFVDSRKNRQDLFDKRLKNYEALTSISSKEKIRLDDLLREGADLKLSTEFVEKFSEECRRARFLFDEDVGRNRQEYRSAMDTFVGASNESRTKSVGGPEPVHFVYGYRGASGAEMTMGRLDYEWENLVIPYLRLGNPWPKRIWDWIAERSRNPLFFVRYQLPYKWRQHKERLFGPTDDNTP